MKTLNCRLGDISITFKAAIPENIGKIVRIVGWHGDDRWWGFDEHTHLWEIEAFEGCYLTYEYENGRIEHVTHGLGF